MRLRSSGRLGLWSRELHSWPLRERRARESPQCATCTRNRWLASCVTSAVTAVAPLRSKRGRRSRRRASIRAKAPWS
eukprot:8657103-Alexandrium_andersonii.AAC.1